MFELQFTYSPWYLLLFSFLMGGVLYVYYFRKSDFSKTQAWILSFLRLAGFLLLLTLLLRPEIVRIEIERLKPKLLWLEDQSASMRYHKDSASLKAIKENWSARKEEIADKYDLQSFYFGEDLSRDSGIADDFTNIYRAYTEARDLYYGEPLGAVVLLSDGIYNQGMNPLDIGQFNSPIYTLAYGNKQAAADIGIADVRYNSTVSLGRKLNIEVDLMARQALGSAFTLILKNAEGETVEERNFEINAKDWFEALILEVPALDEGTKQYNLVILQKEEDSKTSNNQVEIAFKVVKEASEIWIYSRGMHPDVKAIRRAVEKELIYEIKYARNTAEIDFEKAKVIVAFDWDQDLVNQVKALKLPILFMADANSDFQSLKELQIEVQADIESEEQFGLPANPSFIIWPENRKSNWKDWPPIQGIYGKVEKPTWAEAVFYKRIGDLETEEVMAFSGADNKHRMALFLGRGIWRWRIYDYRFNGNTESFDRLFQDWIDYLLSQEREQSLSIEFDRNIYQNKASRVIGKLYDPSGTMVNTPELSLQLKSSTAKIYDYRFSRESNYYRLSLEGLEPGIYSYNAQCDLGERSYTDEGSIVVLRNTLEKDDLIARRSLLRSLADKSGGNYYELEASDSLFRDLMRFDTPQELRERKIKSDLISKWELFFVALIFLSLEWFLRKYWGTY